MRTAVTVAGDLVRELVPHKGLIKGKITIGTVERVMFWHRDGRFTPVRPTPMDLRTKAVAATRTTPSQIEARTRVDLLNYEFERRIDREIRDLGSDYDHMADDY